MADQTQILYYKLKTDWAFRLIFFLWAGLVVALLAISKQDIFQLSMFIKDPQSFPLPLNEWSIRCGNPDVRASLVFKYVVLDFFFPVFIAIITTVLFRGITRKPESADAMYRLFDFRLKGFTMSKASWIVFLFLVCAVLVDWYENYLIYEALVAGERVDSNHYAFVSRLKGLLYLIPIALLLGSFIYTYWLDFGRIWKKYIRYFYPSLIGVGFTFLVFQFFGQAFDFIVESVHPLNLAMFLVLFLFALIGLWMAPYYLWYTQKLKGFEDLNFSQILKYTVVPLLSSKGSVKSKDLEKEALQKRYEKFTHSEEGFFHKMRRSIAIAFIITFLLIQSNLMVEMMGIPSWITALVVLLNLLGIVWISNGFRSARHQDVDEIAQHGEKASILSGYKLNEKSKIFRRSSNFFPIVFVNVLVVLFHLGFCIVYDTSGWAPGEDRMLIWKLIIYAVHTFLFSWAFLIYTLYRKVELEPQHFGSGVRRRIYQFIKKVSYTPTLMKAYFLFSLTAFLIVTLIVAFDSATIESINPLNFFLIILNFFIALLAFIDRVVHASLKSKKIPLGTRSAGVFLVSAVILLIALNSVGSGYHDLDRRSFTEAEDLNYMDLESYTRNFLDSSTTDVVYFIAADGGGLKAAYWTMNVVHKLCLEKPHFFDNTFLTTGASGGMVGLGMYTYLYGQKLTAHERKTKIEELGATNFLNNDLAGLTIKTPVVKLFPFLAGAISDRTAAMSSRYFQLTSKSDEAYDNIQKKPFAHLWQKNRYIGLPLLVVNATKTEDGSRGIIHPLKHIKGDGMIGPLTDLTDYVYENGRLTGVESLNLPDGLFTSNRFPIFSPYARVEGKGHFVDGGYLENSGLSTVYHFLNYMKLQADPTDSTNVFTQFF